MKRNIVKHIRRICGAALGAVMAASVVIGAGAGEVQAEAAVSNQAFCQNYTYTFSDGIPYNLTQLKSKVDVNDPRSVAANVVASVVRGSDSLTDGDAMLSYLCGYHEAFSPIIHKNDWSTLTGVTKTMLQDSSRSYVARSYFNGATVMNGYQPTEPWSITLLYDEAATNETDTVVDMYGIEKIYYRVHCVSSQMSDPLITLERWPYDEDEPDRWWCTQVSSLMVKTPISYKQGTNHDSTYNASSSDSGNQKTDTGNTTTFTDVTSDKYFYTPVTWCVERGITGGIGNGLFGVGQACTREQIVTFLYKASGSPAVSDYSKVNSFSDVKSSSYFYNAVAWAVNTGVTSGMGNGKFGVGRPCTREQAVTFLWKAKGEPAASGTSTFTDVQAGKYYEAPVNWAVSTGVTSGIGGGRFGVGQACMREQIVTFIYTAFH